MTTKRKEGEAGESCGYHYPRPCPPYCMDKGDRFSHRQIAAANPLTQEPRIVAECWTCTSQEIGRLGGDLSMPERHVLLEEIAAKTHHVAGHDVRPVEVKP